MMVPKPADPTRSVASLVLYQGGVAALQAAPTSPTAVDHGGLAQLVGKSADPLRHSLLTAPTSGPPTREELLWVLEEFPAIRSGIVGPLVVGDVPDDGLLKAIQEVVEEQLDRLGRNWSPAGRSLVATMREKFSDPAHHSLLLSLMPSHSERSRFLAGLLVIEEDHARSFAEILLPWTNLLFPFFPEGLDYSVYEHRYRQTRGHLNELDRIERFLFDQMDDLDEIVLEKEEAVNGREDDSRILDRMAFRLALEDAGFELTRVVPEDKNGPIRVQEIGAARHNAMQQVTCLLTFLDVPWYLRGSSDFRLSSGGKTLAAQWRMALHGFAFPDEVEEEEGAKRIWRGHVPDVVIRRHKKGQIPDGARIQVQVMLKGDLGQLVFRSNAQVPSIASRMHQILRNLISNSIKYCNLAEHKPEIEITIQALGLGAFIICRDNGLGGARLGERGHEQEANGQGVGLDWVRKTVEGFFRSHEGLEPFSLITSERVAPGETGGNTTVLLILPLEIFES